MPCCYCCMAHLLPAYRAGLNHSAALKHAKNPGYPSVLELFHALN